VAFFGVEWGSSLFSRDEIVPKALLLMFSAAAFSVFDHNSFSPTSPVPVV